MKQIYLITSSGRQSSYKFSGFNLESDASLLEYNKLQLHDMKK